MSLTRLPQAPVRMERLALPQVTICAVTSLNLQATIEALEGSLSQIDFAACKLFTDMPISPGNPAISVVEIDRLDSSAAYSDFVLSRLPGFIQTDYCLIVQWDGHVLDASRWRAEFLEFDYIGASWPQFDDGHDVGNGGFSLRSHKLMELCQNPKFAGQHPEDVVIARENREWLEAQGMLFAPRTLADQFAAERAGDLDASFGYHGVFNMPRAIGLDSFWGVYLELDDRSTLWHDFASILLDVLRGPMGISRMVRLICDRVRHSFCEH